MKTNGARTFATTYGPARARTDQTSPGRRRSSAVRFLPVLVPLLILIGTGLRGLDFGLHWDERYYQIGPVRTMVISGLPLPRYYGYPSFNYWISSAALIPDAVGAVVRGSSPREELIATTESHAYLLRLRALFLVITSLAVVWTYLLVLVWRRSAIQALLAASILALSWEVAYHLRWVATDGVLMQHGILAVLLAMMALHREGGARWLIGSALAAGLGLGTKYPGGLLILPVLLAALLFWYPRAGLLGTARKLIGLGLVFGGTYLVTTPATILRPRQLLAAIRYEIDHYASGHAGHTVGRGLEHGAKMAEYFGTTAFSPFFPIALLFVLLAVVGCWEALRRSPRTGAVFLVFPVAYLLYFATQQAMVVRNLLVVFPFLAILAALGAGTVWRLAGRSALARFAFASILVVSLGVNAAWLAHTSGTIVARDTDRFVLEAVRHVETEKAATFHLSPRVRAHFARHDRLALSNLTAEPEAADWVLFYAHEAMPRWQDWPANRFGVIERWFGPHEVNFEAYPNWWGDDRIVLVSAETARQLGLKFVRSEEQLPAVGATNPLMLGDRRLDRGSRTRLEANWALPDAHPCTLIQPTELESLVGPLAHSAQQGGTLIDGSACAYLGEAPFVITVGLMSTAAYESIRPERFAADLHGIGVDAFVARPEVPGEVLLFARSVGWAIGVRLTGAQKFAAPEELTISILRKVFGKIPR